MQEALLIEAISQQHLTIKPGQHYRLVLPEDKGQALLVWQDGTDLIIVNSQGEQITLEGYFTTCLENSCSISINEDDQDSEQQRIQLVAENHVVQHQRPRIVYARGDRDILENLLEQQQLDSELLNIKDIKPTAGTSLLPAIASLGSLGLAASTADKKSEPPKQPLATPNSQLAEDTGRSATDNITKSADLNQATNTSDDAQLQYRLGKQGETLGPWQAEYSAPTEHGNYTLEIRQFRDSNDVSPTQTINFTLDTSAPTIPNGRLSNDSGASDLITNNGAISAPTNIEADALLQYRSRKDNGSYSAWSTAYTAPDTNTSANGTYHVQIRQTDVAGNVSPVQTISYTLDTIAPTLTITGNGALSDGKRLISFALSEAVSNFTAADITVSNGSLKADSFTGSGTSYQAEVIPDLAEGHTNVVINVAAGSFSDVSFNANSQTVYNQTSLDNLSQIANFPSANIATWDTSRAISANNTFENNTTFNQALGSWDVSNITSLQWTFKNATAFNQSLASWNTSKVTSMQGSFSSASSFNQTMSTWNTQQVTDMGWMFFSATSFNQDINNWNTAKVEVMTSMFSGATNFNQNLANWDISNLISANDMFDQCGLSMANLDLILAGWAKLDTSQGETAIQNNVKLGMDGCTYANATAKQYLIDQYAWEFDGGRLGANVSVGSNTEANTIDKSTSITSQTLHGLGGNDSLTGGSANDLIVGGAGNDELTGGLGMDVFDFNFSNAGTDTIKDFSMGNGGDQIDIKDLLIGYNNNLADFVNISQQGSHTQLHIDADGRGSETALVTIILENINSAASANFLNDMLNQENLVVL